MTEALSPSDSGAGVRWDGIRRTFPGRGKQPPVVALDSLDLEGDAGQLLVLVGPSGSGKSTALRALAGLEDLDEGTVHIGGTDVTRQPPHKRDVAMVFQDLAMFPHLDVRDNIMFGPQVRALPAAEASRRLEEVVALLGLDGLLERRPNELSGGQRQRVALARAMVREPAVFLLDEPLSNLDAQLRAEARGEIVALQRRLGTTMVYVTHDQVEAMTMGDRIAVLNHGRLEQVGSPRELYDRPANLFVAGFLGAPPMNLLSSEVLGALPGGLRSADGARLDIADGVRTIGVRPEDLVVRVDSDGEVPVGEAGLRGEVIAVEDHGNDRVLLVSGPDGVLRTRLGAGPLHAVLGDGAELVVRDGATVHRFDAEGQRIA